MTDYSKWKVTELKAELKQRGIAQTGLRVKQQFIDRLLEEDAKGQNGDGNGEPTTAEEATHEESQPVEPQAGANTEDTNVEEQKEDKPTQIVDEPETAKTESKTAEEIPADAATQEQPSLGDRSTEPPPQSAPVEEPGKETQEEKAEAQVDVSDEKVQTEPTPEPVEQAPGDATVGEPSTNGARGRAAPSEPVEKAGETGTGTATPLPSDEILEDRRKRKRRSQSPVPTPEDIARKKAKAEAEAEEGAAPISENKDAMDVDTAPQTEGPAPASKEVPQRSDETPGKEDVSLEESESKKSALKQDVRFKGLFAPTEREPARPSLPHADIVPEDIEVEPALHAATAALYIDGLMRPLQPAALKTHLLAIATSPGASPNPDLIVDFYLDPIKTHCFVTFVNVSTASRARTSLHGTVWPNERNRKSLFVDFIPEHKVHEWIRIEDDSRPRVGPPPRWEVKYNKTDDGVEAVLEEVDPKNSGSHISRGPPANDFARPPPLGPKADMINKDRRPSAPSAANASSQPGQGFKPLDELFMSTTAKPKLYYLPVPRDVADRRLDRFDDLLQKGSFPRRGGDDTRRITFEDGDLFVDVGPEYPGRGRGGRGRGRGRGGGMGDQWRDSRRG